MGNRTRDRVTISEPMKSCRQSLKNKKKPADMAAMQIL